MEYTTEYTREIKLPNFCMFCNSTDNLRTIVAAITHEEHYADSKTTRSSELTLPICLDCYNKYKLSQAITNKIANYWLIGALVLSLVIFLIFNAVIPQMNLILKLCLFGLLPGFITFIIGVYFSPTPILEKKWAKNGQKIEIIVAQKNIETS